MTAPPRSSALRNALLTGAGAGALVAAIFVAWSGTLHGPWIAVLVGGGAFAGWFVDRRVALQRARAEAAEADIKLLLAELATVRGQQESLASDLTQIGNYGNLLLDCTDLAEVLQISQQFLLRLLPGCAGSFYPLIDGEGLSEATHLWGTHAAETKAQATLNDCRAIGAMRVHVADDGDPTQLCAHVVTDGNGNGNGKPTG